MLAKRFLATASKNISVGLLIKRNPIVVPKLSEFEQSYYEYREALERAEALPVGAEFYFKKGTEQEKVWINAQEQFKDQIGGVSYLPDLQKSEMEKLQLEPVKDDGDLVDSQRKMPETVYVMIGKTKGGKDLTFPKGIVKPEESLSEAADRLAREMGLNVQVVGNFPVAFSGNGKEQGKVFYMLCNLLTPPKAQFNFLTRREVKKHVNESSVTDAL